eukprot:scaffold42867_cov63-Phaeocystis_antarctica.AAC.4
MPRNPGTASATGAAVTVASRVPRSFGRHAPRPFEGGPKEFLVSGVAMRLLVVLAATRASSPPPMRRLKPPPSWPFEPSACSTAWVSQPPVFWTVRPAGVAWPQSLAGAPKLATSVGGVSMERGRLIGAERRLLSSPARRLQVWCITRDRQPMEELTG